MGVVQEVDTVQQMADADQPFLQDLCLKLLRSKWGSQKLEAFQVSPWNASAERILVG